MPTHWESSKRPLFVRTVVVDGNRHAILSQEDPLGQTHQSKHSRPGSGRSSSSNDTKCYNDQLANEDEIGDNGVILKGEKKGHRDLQSCLIKLRLVLSTQERRRALNGGLSNSNMRSENKKRKKTTKKNNGKRSCDWHAESQEEQQQNKTNAIPDCNKLNNDKEFRYDSNHNIEVATFFASEPLTRFYSPNTMSSEYEASYFTHQEPKLHPEPEQEPTRVKGLNLTSDYDIPWNTVSSDCYFTRPFYNRLSERVLQWVDLASKKKNKGCNVITNNEDKKTEIFKAKAILMAKDNKLPKKIMTQRDNSEENFDEVKQEEDVDTFLSRELPQFSEELNRLHNLKSEIPAKHETLAKQLQDSIAESFNNVVSIRSGKYALLPKATVQDVNETKTDDRKSNRRSLLKRQNKLEDNSDEDTLELLEKESLAAKEKNLLQKALERRTIIRQIPPVFQFSTAVSTKFSLFREPRNIQQWPNNDTTTPKPQLHIFMPTVDDSNNAYDSESCESLG